MKDILQEEISLMKKLFDIKGGFLIHEQNALPGGISKQAYDKIIATSQQNKKNLSGSYLAPAQQKVIDSEFGTGTYDKFFKSGGKDILDNKKVTQAPQKKTLPEIPLPAGVSKQAYDKIIAVSQQNKKNLSGSYLAPAQQRAIDSEFGTGMYDKFFNNGGRDVLDGKKVFKLDASANNQTSNSRQTNINNIFCSVKGDVITAIGSKFTNTKWSNWLKTYPLKPQEIAAAKASCPNSELAKTYKNTSGSGQQNVSQRFSKSLSSAGIQNGKMDVQTLQKILSTLEGGQSNQLTSSQSQPDLAQLTAAINQLG
jgi:hypothetical protein